MEHRNDEIFRAIGCVSIVHLSIHQINHSKFDSAWRVSILDSERQRTLRVYRGVRLGSTLIDPRGSILINMGS
jgi:hypothetical protein